MKLWLSADEIRDLTGMEKPSAQMRVLDTLGIRYRERGDGTFVVFIYNNIIELTHMNQVTEYPMDFSSLQ